MPDILTHAYCADFARRHFDADSVLRQIIDNNLDAYYLGAQGPDFFFYYRIWPWKNAHSVPSMAESIHKSKTSEFLDTAIRLLKLKDIGGRTGQRTLAYWMGFLTHYALDTTAHPYIHYHAGIYAHKGHDHRGQRHNHKYLENIIDSLLSERFENLMDLPKNQTACLPPKPASLKGVFENFSEVYYNVYGKMVNPEIIMEAVTDMKNLIRLMHDPKRRKRAAFTKIERLIGKPRYITTAAYPATGTSDADYLNLKHHTWVHPCDVTLEYNTSFMELFDKATLHASDLMQYAWDTFKDTSGSYDLAAYLGNLSYDTGLKCDDPRELKYSDSIFNR